MLRVHSVLLTKNIHMSILDAIDTLFDGLITADVEYSQRESLPIRVPGGFYQFVFTFQITHCGYDCGQLDDKGKCEELRSLTEILQYLYIKLSSHLLWQHVLCSVRPVEKNVM